MLKTPEANSSSWKSAFFHFYVRYRHGLLMLYMLIYFPWFSQLERTVTTRFHVIHMAVDDLIPFCEYFIIPYLAWFPFVAGAVLYFFFTSKEDYYKLCAFLFVGMTVFLLISTLYPNGAYLRPEVFDHKNVYIEMVKMLYSMDTPTNLFPSIHVYNSIGVCLAVWNSRQFRDKFRIRLGTMLMSISIVLSTVFLKQHSMFDVLTAFVMAFFLYTIVYNRNAVKNGQYANENQYQHG